MCGDGDSNMAEKWKEVEKAQLTEFRKRYILSEHNQEADQLANLGTKGKAKTTIDGVKNAEEWKSGKELVGWKQKETMEDAGVDV